jgi:hypothetical protein
MLSSMVYRAIVAYELESQKIAAEQYASDVLLRNILY